MRRLLKSTALMLLMTFALSSCYTMTHVVGDGAQSGVTTEKRQWYALWGLVPINEVDSKALAGNAEDYTITTTHSFVDQVIGLFTSVVTIVPATVKVTK